MLFIKLLALTIAAVSISSQKVPKNPLANQQLRIIWTRRGGEYNSSYVGTKLGGLMVDYLASRFHFKYTYLTVKELYLYPVGKFQKGLVDYLSDGQCDLLAHDVLMNIDNYKQMDLTSPYLQTAINFMVPVPDTTANLDAVVKPFQWPVWISLAISLFATIFALKLVQLSRIPTNLDLRGFSCGSLPSFRQRESTENSKKRNKGFIRNSWTRQPTWNPYLYVFGMLLSQGGPCTRRNIASRIVAGTWCVATFVFVQAYTSTLFTYIVTSTAPLLVDSVYDVINKPAVNLIVEAGRSFENTIVNTQEKKGVFKQLRDKLEVFPKTRCYKASECLSLVKTGPNIVHANAYHYLVDYMIVDFKETGKCNLQLAKHTFWPVQIVWASSRNSPYTDTITKGMLEMRENGLIEHWDSGFRSIPGKCHNYISNKGRKSTKRANASRLSLRNLTGAFIVLLIGDCLAFTAYLGEQTISYAIRHHPLRRHN